MADNIHGNGDGRVQRGEQVTVYFTVKNVSEVDSFPVQANLQNKSGAGVLLHDGRFRREALPAGEEWAVPFSFQVLSDFQEDEATLLLGVVDTELGAAATHKLKIPIYDEPGQVTKLPAKRVVSLEPGTEVRERPDARCTGDRDRRKARALATHCEERRVCARQSRRGSTRLGGRGCGLICAGAGG